MENIKKEKIKVEENILYDYLYISFDDLDPNQLLSILRFFKKVYHNNIDRNELIEKLFIYILEISIKDTQTSKEIINNYYKNVKKYNEDIISFRRNNKEIIKVYEKYILSNSKYEVDILRYIFHILYNENILYDNYIIDWYDNIKEKKILDSVVMKDFINWLRDEDSSEDEEDKTAKEA